MGIIDQIQQMKSQGMPDEEIVTNLKQQGISPKEINDALNQAQIKNAVTGEQNQDYTPPGGYEQSSYSSGQGQYSTQDTQQGQYPSQDQQQGQYYQEAGNYQQQYDQSQMPPAQAGVDADSVMDISERVFDEKIKKFEKQLADFVEFKTLSQTKIDNLSERLKRIETMIDQLQIKILEKISSYGENLNSIKGEMSMMQDSFQKMTNPILDRMNEKNSNFKTSSSQISQNSQSPPQSRQQKSSIEEDENPSSTIDDVFRKAVSKKK